MTQSGDPLENSLAERVNGILKDELLEKQYRNFEQAGTTSHCKSYQRL
jgi:hypothetical protein